MACPTLEQYNQAFSAHSTLLADAELRVGTLAKSGLGLPLAISGGIALTYTVGTSQGKFAVRCFQRDLQSGNLMVSRDGSSGSHRTCAPVPTGCSTSSSTPWARRMRTTARHGGPGWVFRSIVTAHSGRT